jgi:hypothetical protein
MPAWSEGGRVSKKINVKMCKNVERRVKNGAKSPGARRLPPHSPEIPVREKNDEL